MPVQLAPLNRSHRILMTPLKSTSLLVATALVLAAFPISTSAQKGDKQGEVQQSRIPKEKIPANPPLSPPEALKKFKLQPGFQVELVTSEPVVVNPVALQFDPEGRIWVLEMRSFMPTPDGKGETTPTGRVSILEDADGDGRAERSKVVLDGLVMPRAFLLVDGGLLVCEPPALWFYPIKNDHPGPRVLVAADFAKDADPSLGLRMNPEHSGNSLVRGLDNWIYSLYHPWRYRLGEDLYGEGAAWQREWVPQRAQWGHSMDDFGRLFYTSNSDQLRGDLVPVHYFAGKITKGKYPGVGIQIAKDQSVWPARINPGVNRGYQTGTLREDGTLAKFTAACGTCIYRDDVLGQDVSGNAFICEPSANIIRRNKLSEKDGIVTAQNAYEKDEFLASTDELFRPVNLYTGPDGALYIVDMYHGIIQHRFFLTSYLRQQAEDRGLDKVAQMGRIWRVVPDSKPLRKEKPALGSATTGQLAQTLRHPNGWWRDTAQRLLVARKDAAATPALEKLASDSHPITRLHALWTLEGVGQLQPKTVLAALADTHPKVRAAALRLTEDKKLSSDASLQAARLKLVDDAEADVQTQLALSLSLEAKDPVAKETLKTLSKKVSAPLAKDATAFALIANDPPKPVVAMNARALTAEEEKRYEAGKTMYEITCLACHQQHGLGQPGLAPPLAGSEWVAGSEKRLVLIILHGLRGPIKVKGEIFDMDMPTLNVLDDEQIASALTYIRREWGHGYEPVTPATVKAIRAETEQREDAWTMAELLKIP